MSIQHFLNKSVIIRRLSDVSGNRKQYVATGTFDMHIQRITDESGFQIYGVLGATHKAWTDAGLDIKEGDRALDPDGNQYQVVAVNRQDFGMNQHLEIILKHYSFYEGGRS